MNPTAAPAQPVKDFLSILDLQADGLLPLLDLSAQLKAERPLADQAPTANALRGAHVGLLFEKPSLRTRATFEIAIRELGGQVLDIREQFADGSREPLEDVARNLERWVKALVIRSAGVARHQCLERPGASLPGARRHADAA
jgi:ornithine carbamoyltransferase